MNVVAPAELLHSSVPRELQFKILVIGEYGVGKTAVIRRYAKGHYSPGYKMTIGVDFAVKTIDLDPKTKVNIQLWDIAGHERFGHLTRVYYKYAVGAIVVFDLSRPPTYDAVPQWVNDVRDKVALTDGRPIPVLLLANKCDVENITIQPEIISEFCKHHQIDAWFMTSAKEDINVGDAMKWLVERILEQRSTPSLVPAICTVTSVAPEDKPRPYCCR